jgi:hypothetical protein
LLKVPYDVAIERETELYADVKPGTLNQCTPAACSTGQPRTSLQPAGRGLAVRRSFAAVLVAGRQSLRLARRRRPPTSILEHEPQAFADGVELVERVLRGVPAVAPRLLIGFGLFDRTTSGLGGAMLDDGSGGPLVGPERTIVVAPGEVKLLQAVTTAPVDLPAADVLSAAAKPRIAIEAISPSVNGGRFAAKRLVGDMGRGRRRPNRRRS